MTRAQERRERSIVRLLNQPGAKGDLDKLCASGCDRDGFIGRLLASSELIAFDRMRPSDSSYAFPTGREVTKLVADIEQLATRIERTNADRIVSPAVVLDALTKPRDPKTELDYKRQILFYQGLPELLRKYAGDVRKSYKFAMCRIGPKRFSFDRYLVQKLLEYVQTQTGKPHYEPVQRLLESAFRVTAGVETPIPKLLESPDALKQLWARSLKYGFRDKK
jgi:hypothetical protein